MTDARQAAPGRPPGSPDDAEDTPADVRVMMIEGYRRMSPTEKLQRVLDLNRAAESFARARIRRQYGPDLTEREENLRLASLTLDRETMIRAFDWDPEEHGR